MFWNPFSLLLLREDFHIVFIPQVKSLNRNTLMNGNAPVVFFRLPGLLGDKVFKWQTENKISNDYLLR